MMAQERAVREEGIRLALRLEYFTIAWNIIEAVVAVGANAPGFPGNT